MILRFDRRLLRNVDWPLLGAAFVLVTLSVVCLSNLGAGRGGPALAWRQLVWVGVGLVALLVLAALDYRNIVRAAPGLYLLGVGLLVTVFVLGRTVSGARRWIHVGPITFQPSELFKIIFIITLAWALTWRRSTPQTTRGTLGWMLALVAVPFVLVVRQPDLGTALVLVPVLGAILVGMGLGLRILGALAAGAVAVMPLAWPALKPYEREGGARAHRGAGRDGAVCRPDARQPGHGHGPLARRGHSVAADELWWFVHGRVLHGFGTPSLGANAAVPVTGTRPAGRVTHRSSGASAPGLGTAAVGKR